MRRHFNCVSIRVLVAAALVGGANAGAQTITWDGPTRGSQNLATSPTLPFAAPGTYTITVDTGIVVTFRGAAAGGGGSSGYSSLLPTYDGPNLQYGGGGGGGGAVTTGTTVQFLPARTYRLVVGAGGAGGANAFSKTSYATNPGAVGGSTTLVNASDGITLVSLAGGRGGSGNSGGAGGLVSVGSNAVSGGAGGYGAPSVPWSPMAGGAGSAASSGAGGGGGGGAGDNDSGSQSGGGRGGSGSHSGGNGGPSPWSAGDNNSGLAGGGGGATSWGGGGGGGGGGAAFNGLVGAFGGGGGGGGGTGTGPESTAANGLSGRGGAGQNGVALLVFVNSCAYALSPAAADLSVAGASGTIAVTTDQSCAWTATSSAAWLTIAAGASATGPAVVSYTAAANTTNRGRVATITVGGQRATLTQAAGTSADPIVAWSGATSGSQNLARISYATWTQPGTYTLTVNNPLRLTFRGVAGGGGGGSNGNSGDGGGGGGGGARTTGAVVTLVPGKSYTLLVGAGATMGGAGGTTSLVNVTDNVPLVWLNGGTGGGRQTAGVGGLATYGDGGVSGGSGGEGSRENSGIGGAAGSAYSSGTGGGGGGGAFDWRTNSGNPGGAGGAASGGPPPGSGGATGASGGNGGGAAASGGASGGTDGGGGGGGGGVNVPGLSDTLGGGGGGGGGSITAFRAGGAGQNGAAVLAASCAFNVVPTTVTSAAAGGSGTIAVAASGCAWTATSGASWLTIASGASGASAGTVSYQVAANFTGAARTTSLSVGGQTIPVTQAATDHVVVTASAPTLLFRGSQTLTATAYDSANHVIPNVAFTWASGDAGVVSVGVTSTNTATITAVGISRSAVTITAKPVSGQSGSIQVVVDPGRVLIFDGFIGPTGTPIAQHQPMINQANGTWRVTGSPDVLTGGAAYPSGPGDGHEMATIEAGASDASIAADWNPASTDNAYGGIVFRKSDAWNYWVACYYSRKIALVRYTAGVPMIVAEDEIGPRQPRHLDVHLSGDAISVWSDGVSILQAIDAFNATATEHGLHWWSYGDPWSTLTNFEVNGTLLPLVTSISLDAPTTAIVDRAVTMTATLRDAAGAPVSGSYVRWSTSSAAGTSMTPATALTATFVSSEIGTFTVIAKAPRGPAAGASATINVSACVDPLTVDSMTVPYDGGARVLAVTAPGDCTWKLRNAAEWIAVSGGATTGPRSVSFAIEANGYPWPRSAPIVIGGRRLTITQDARPCSIAFWPGSGHWAGDGGSGGFDITTPAGCGWWITTSAPWVHLNNLTGSGVGGNGSATVTFIVDPNPTASTRSAVIGGSGINYPITQDAAGTIGGGGGSGGGVGTPGNCKIELSPGYVSFGSGGGTRSLSIAAGSGCASSIVAGAFGDWIDFDFRSGSGSWQTNYFVHANTGDRPRTALVQVGTAVLRIDQNAAGDNPFFRKILEQNGVPSNVPQAGEDCTMQCTGSNPISCTVTCTPPVINLPLPPIMPWPDPPGGGDPPCDITRFRVDANGTPSCEPIPGGGEEPPPPLSPGIFLKVHWISITNYLHASIRIVLSEEDLDQVPLWRSQFKFDFGSGFWVATIGADGSTFCGGVLKSDVDRPQDMYNAPAIPPEHLSYSPPDELALVDRLFRLDQGYADNLLYACFPTPENQYYNSNSFAAGLLLAAGVPMPMTPQVNLPKFPGWAKPVPAWLFFTR